MKEEPQRRFVGPLRVVDRQEQRGAFGEVHHQPVQPVQGGERDVTGFLGRCNLGEHRFGEPRRTRQQPIAFRAVSTDQRAFEQLANDPEAKPPLELSAAGGQHGHPARTGTMAHRLEQHRLPNACRPLDQHYAARACDRLGQGSIEYGEIVLAFEQQQLLA